MPCQPGYDYGDAKRPMSLLITRGPGYYDSPEGQAPWEKLWGINKYAISSSLFMTVGDCLFLTQTQTILQSLNVLGFWLARTCSLATTFAATVYIATNVRGKDDKWNYTLGVAACMPITYTWWKSCRPMWHIAFAMEIAALVKKTAVQYDYKMIQPINFEQGNFMYNNYSLVKADWPKRPY